MLLLSFLVNVGKVRASIIGNIGNEMYVMKIMQKFGMKRVANGYIT